MLSDKKKISVQLIVFNECDKMSQM
jgi:hypothetical protein